MYSDVLEFFATVLYTKERQRNRLSGESRSEYEKNFSANKASAIIAETRKVPVAMVAEALGERLDKRGQNKY